MTDRALTPEEQLLQAALREADQVPSHVVEYARAVYRWRDIDLELATLTSDSTSDELIGVRGGGAIRFSFTDASGGTVELTYDPEESSLAGRIDPPGTGAGELMTAGDTVTTDIADGSFVFTSVPRGPVSIIVRLEDGRSFKTEWLTL